MYLKSSFSRREVVKKIALASMTLPFLKATAESVAANSRNLTTPDRTHGLTLGVAGYSLRELSVEHVISVLQELNIKHFAVFKTHVPIESGSVENCRIAREKFVEGGITLTSTGVVNFSKDQDAKRPFENARAANLKTITCKPAPDSLPELDRLVKEYDIKLAIHNHGPEDALYPTPDDVWKAIQPYDQRIGLCIDVGHTARFGKDPVEALHKYRARLYDVHLKDSIAPVGEKMDIPVEVGRGRIDMKGILAALIEIKYPYQAGFEYEKSPNNPVPGLAESVGYVRGMLAAM